MQRFRSLIALTLSLALILLSPGSSAYHAAAQTMGAAVNGASSAGVTGSVGANLGRGAGVNAIPMLSPSILNLSSVLSAPSIAPSALQSAAVIPATEPYGGGVSLPRAVGKGPALKAAASAPQKAMFPGAKEVVSAKSAVATPRIKSAPSAEPNSIEARIVAAHLQFDGGSLKSAFSAPAVSGDGTVKSRAVAALGLAVGQIAGAELGVPGPIGPKHDLKLSGTEPKKLAIRGNRSASLYRRGNPAARKKFVADLMGTMTLEEKIAQLNQGFLGLVDNNPAMEHLSTTLDDIRAGRVGSLLGMSDVKEINRIQKIFVEESRLKIPAFFGYDAIHGMFTNFGTNLAFASSFDPKLVRRIYQSIGREVAAAGAHIAYSPMLDLVRGNPFWGRGMEGYGEDPTWGAQIGYEAVRGLQEMGVAATPKHFAFYGANEGADYSRLRVGRDEWGDYLRPFRAAIKDAGARGFMWGFGSLDGEPVTAHPELNEIMRKHFGKNGKRAIGFSDWNSVGERGPNGHRVDMNLAGSAERGVLNGVDVDMVSKAYDTHLSGLVAKAKGKEKRQLLKRIDESVERVLLLKHDLGLFKNPYMDPTRVERVARSAAHQQVALESALKSMVLLKNDAPMGGTTPILPLGKAAKRIAVVGPLAASQSDPRGAWFSESKPENVVSVLDGMRRHVQPGTEVVYAAGGTVERSTPQQIGAAVRAAKDADVTIVVVGESWGMSGEAQSRSFLGLPGDQQKLVDAIAKTGKPYVVVLMNGRPLAIPEIAATAPAIVEAWHAGDRTGDALAKLLTGQENFSGKLPVSFPRFAGQRVYYNHTNTGRPALDGDNNVIDPAPSRSRWYNNKTANIDPKESTPLYTFGEGKSYTSYSYETLQLSSPRIGSKDKLTVTAHVTNTGNRAGEEIVQLYIGDDIRRAGTPPVKELKAFQRVHLEPGERKVVEFTIGRDELSFFDQKLKKTTEPGSFTVWVAPSSVGGLKGQFELTAGRRP